MPDPKLNSCVTSHYIYLFVFLYKQTFARRYEEIPFKLCGLRLCHVLLLALLTGSRMGMLRLARTQPDLPMLLVSLGPVYLHCVSMSVGMFVSEERKH